MIKRGGPTSGPAGLADWLPLLGSICQALSSIAEESDEDTANGARAAEKGGDAAQRPHSSSSASQ